MKIKPFILLVFLSFISNSIFSQVAADPLDYFYSDLVIWETSGLVNNLPPARPYPLQLVKEILQTVIERGDSTQKKMAETHYKRFFGRTVTFGGKSEAVLDTEKSLKQLGVALSLDFNAEIEKYLTISGSVDGWAINKLPDEEVLATWDKSGKDIVEDNAKVGPFYILPSVNSSVAVGNTEYYFNAGMMRGSFGPFHSNGVIVSPLALHSGQYSYAVNKKKWGFNYSFYSLTASSVEGDWYPEKFMALRSIDYRPFDWLSVSFLDSVLYGGRIEPMYFLPFSPFMISQGQTGLMDNCYLGGMFTVKPFQEVKIDGVLYADDLSFNDLARLNFDTKLHLAGQLGASYAPKKSGIFTLISFDYTMVTPYTYAHRESEALDKTAPNYLNYLQAGNSFGASLDPNSDRINLKIKLRPLEGIDFDLIGVLIRHGNVNENIDMDYITEYLTHDKYITDGTVLNSARTDIGSLAQSYNPFLTQDTLQYIWQTGFDATCRLPILKTGGSIVFRFGYRFECNMNDGVNNPVYRSGDSSLTYGTDAEGELVITSTDAEIKAAAENQLMAWRENAKGISFNNIISAGFEYYY
jgi:hypothetical protein